MILYGIATCDTCKLALKALKRSGRDVTFRDVRANPLTEAEIDRLVGALGDRLINKQSTTYRGFGEFLRASDPEAQIAAQPTVMKRPVIEVDGTYTIGWDAAIEAALTA